jgi:translocation and assembly module TamB
MDDEVQSSSPVPPPAPAEPAAVVRQRRRWLVVLLAAVVATIVLLSTLTGGLYWAALTPGGTAWLLANLARVGIGVSATEPQGSLVGDFRAKQVVVDIRGTRVVIDEPAWQALGVSYAGFAHTWATLDVLELKARRVTLTLPPPSDKPLTLPHSLRLPFSLQVHSLQVDEVLLPWLTQPLREVQAEVQLGADQGALHRVDALRVRLDPMQIEGNGRIATSGDMPLQVELRAAQSAQAAASGAGPALPAWSKTLRADWQAQLKAQGPLARIDLQAMLRAQGQQLDASAQYAMLERWPLPQLDLRTQSFDLSALSANAPLTSLSGQITINATRSAPNAPASELVAKGDLRNAQPGRWDQKRVPLRGLQLELQAQTDRVTALTLRRFEAQLAGARDAGTLKGQGHWNAEGFGLSAELTQVQPSALDARLPAMTLSGPVKLSGQTPKGPDGQPTRPSFTALADLNGRLTELAQSVHVKLAASGDPDRIELQEFRAQAGKAQATLTGRAEHEGGVWRAKATAALVEFDPRPWFPGPTGSSWQKGPHRLNLKGNADLSVPESVKDDKRTPLQRATQVVGMVTAQLNDSVFAGVPVSGEAALRHASENDTVHLTASLDAAGNTAKVDVALSPDNAGQRDQGSFELEAPLLARIAPLLQLIPAVESSGMTKGLSGQAHAEGQFRGRWPVMSTEGKAEVDALRAGPLASEEAKLRWKLGSTPDAVVDAALDITQAAWEGQQIGATTLQLKGTPGQHELHARSELRAAPPAWMEGLQARAGAADTPLGRSRIQLDAKGGLEGGFLAGANSNMPLGWKGMLQQLELRSGDNGNTPLLVVKSVGVELAGQPLERLVVSAGRADILGAGLRWDRIEWQPGEGLRAQQLDMQAELEPIAIAPLLRRMQPSFGWGGDLTIGGKVVIKQTDRFTADIVIERKGGDLNVTDETGTQALGLTDIRLALEAKDGEWNFTQGLAGTALGTAAGALVVHTTPTRAWPEATAPVEGVMVAQVDNLGTWGSWVPAGWRLGGNLRASASIGGRFNGIEYTGELKGSGIEVRNLLQGVSVTQGEVDIALQGDNAKINTLRARAGNGEVRIEGDARLGEAPQARLTLTAEKFQALGRVDRRVVTSGQATVLLDKEKLDVDGKFQVDEALIDFSRSNAPALASDVTVSGRPGVEEEPPPMAPGKARAVNVNLQLNLGENLRLKGRGLETRLRGELKLTTPGGKPALNGTVSAADGTYAAYGQKLQIDRGEVVFSGAMDNPRVDIEATRPNLDVRVGVIITGPLMSLRVRLFSEPEMSNTDKLSWLMLGRASDGLGRTDTALLQRAALALLAGEGEGVTDQITKALGLDEISVSSNTTAADTRETLVSFGKQLSQRVFLTYEQNLNTSSGSVQLTYRIAQRFLARVQGGIDDRSVDFVWAWRWE